MKKLTPIAIAIFCLIAAALLANIQRAAATSPGPSLWDRETDTSYRVAELFDCSGCSKGGNCPKVCSSAPPAKPSQSQNTHGCACLHNETERSINFRYNWGSGSWKEVNMQPNFQYSICWRYAAGSNSSPTLQFELDVDMTKGSAWKTYSIGRVQARGNSCNLIAQDAHYTVMFRPGTNKQFIDVYKR